MLFNSLQFILFFPVVVFIYFIFPPRHRYILLLLASYYFYMSWKPEYIILIIISTLSAYLLSLRMGQIPVKSRRKKYLLLSLFINLGLLFTFKYFNFFFGSVIPLFTRYCFNSTLIPPYLNVIIPVGISFYTFQTISYTIDVYNERIKPEKNLGIFALYVSFFPQLIAGPIERATNLLPQFFVRNSFDIERIINGLKIMIWGFFLKVVIADQSGVIVNQVYRDPEQYVGIPLILASYLFSFQIYCDFAGYSFIAIGTAYVLGYRLMENFRRPYFARSIPEFWRRWHISLSTWCRDYIYIPLGGNRVSKRRLILNIFIVFFLSGLWHGAAWTFLIWGLLHAFYQTMGIIARESKKRITRLRTLEINSKIGTVFSVLVTFHLVTFSWIFFRAGSLGDALYIITHLLDFSSLHTWDLLDLMVPFGFIFFMEIVHLNQELKFSDRIGGNYLKLLRLGFYVFLLLSILLFGFQNQNFIYFQF